MNTNKTKGKGSWKVWAGRLGIGVVILLLWEFATGTGRAAFMLSKPSAIAIRIYDIALNGKLWMHLSTTLQEVLIGMAIGMVLGVLLGIVLSYSGIIQHWLSPYILAVFSLPKAALGPMFIMWFGIGIFSKVLMVVIFVMFVVFYNIYEGVKNISPDLYDMMSTFGAGRFKWLKWVVLPSLASLIVSSLRISIGNAVIGAVIAEMIGANRGIGYYIIYSTGISDITGAMAGLMVIMAVALILGETVGVLERRINRW